MQIVGRAEPKSRWLIANGYLGCFVSRIATSSTLTCSGRERA